MDTNILLENGTNELEVLEFVVAGNSYGINVAKIKEIIPYQAVTPVPNAHPSIEGLFMPRDTVITAIDLKNCLQLGSSEPGGLFFITNFNNLDVAFHIDSVVGIHRVSWADIINPNATIANGEDSISTGIVKINGKLIIIIDFERIVSYINPSTGLKVDEILALDHIDDRKNYNILIAEDSMLLNKLIVGCLQEAGYTKLTNTFNGKECYDKVVAYRDAGNLDDNVDLIITDIEMPVMDGHRLIKLLKSDSSTSHIPIIIFSSLVNDEMKKKGEALGVDGQLSKPEIGNLVKLVDSFLIKND